RQPRSAGGGGGGAAAAGRTATFVGGLPTVAFDEAARRTTTSTSYGFVQRLCDLRWLDEQPATCQRQGEEKRARRIEDSCHVKFPCDRSRQKLRWTACSGLGGGGRERWA